MSKADHAIRRILAFDALTCLLCGMVMSIGASFLSRPFGLPSTLILFAGLALLGVAVLFWWISRTPRLGTALVMVAVVGNAGWVVASVGMVFLTDPTFLGTLFILAQALVVAALAVAEYLNMPNGRKAHAAA